MSLNTLTSCIDPYELKACRIVSSVNGEICVRILAWQIYKQGNSKSFWTDLITNILCSSFMVERDWLIVQNLAIHVATGTNNFNLLQRLGIHTMSSWGSLLCWAYLEMVDCIKYIHVINIPIIRITWWASAILKLPTSLSAGRCCNQSMTTVMCEMTTTW